MKILDALKKKSTKKADAAAPASESAAKEQKATALALAKDATGSAYRVLQRPVVTEKSARLQGQSAYVFQVSIDANKTEVARAFRQLYGVKPLSVRIVRMRGKHVSFGRFSGKEKAFKKAVITLKKGETVSVFGA